MRIGIVCYPTFGGSGVVATELGKALADKGHQVHFITYTQPVRLEHYHKNLLYHEVRVPQYPLFEYLPYETALASKLVDVAEFHNLDVVHVHYAIPHASAAYLAKQILRQQGIQLPVVTTLHGTDITLVGRHSTYAPVVSFSINQSDGVTAVSDYLKQATIEHFDVDQPIEVIPNFIDMKRFEGMYKEHFRKAIADEHEKVLIHVSNFRKVKRVQDVLYTFNEVQKEVPSKLLLVGDGPERSNVEKICRDLPACPDVRFLGKQEPIEELLAISDLFLLPSESESFGLAALEAMGAGVPVLSTNIGGLPEINQHGQTGFLNEVGDTATMAANAITLLTDEQKLQTFKKNARQRARKYDIDRVLPQYEQFYESIINAPSQTASVS